MRAITCGWASSRRAADRPARRDPARRRAAPKSSGSRWSRRGPWYRCATTNQEPAHDPRRQAQPRRPVRPRRRRSPPSSTAASSASRSCRASSAAAPCSCAPRGGDNHHDLGLFSVGPEAPRAPRGSTGLYHLAWEVPTIEDLADGRARALGGRRARWRERPRRLEVALRRRSRRQRVRDHVARARARPGASSSSAAPSCRSTSTPRSAAGARLPARRTSAPLAYPDGWTAVSGDRSQSGVVHSVRPRFSRPSASGVKPEAVPDRARDDPGGRAVDEARRRPSRRSPTSMSATIMHGNIVSVSCSYGPTTSTAPHGSARARWSRHVRPAAMSPHASGLRPRRRSSGSRPHPGRRG